MGKPFYAGAKGETFPQVFLELGRVHSRRTALRVRRDGRYRNISWSDLVEKVSFVGLGLRSLGVEKGDRVAIVARNRPEWAYADLGILGIGAVSVPLYPVAKPGDVEDRIRHCGARAIFLEGPKLLRRFGSLRDRIPELKHWIVFQEAPDLEDVVPLDALLAKGAARRGTECFEDLVASGSPEDLATIIYTPYSTGRPRGASITHGNILWTLKAAAAHYSGFTGGCGLSCLPLSHVFERFGGLYCALFQGGVLAFARGLHTIAEDLLEARPTVLLAVPRIYEKIYATLRRRVKAMSPLRRAVFLWALGVGHREGRSVDDGRPVPLHLRLQSLVARLLVFRSVRASFGGRIRYLVSAGAPLPRKVAEFFRAMEIPIFEGYGLTETTGPATANLPNDNRIDSVGFPLPGVRIRLSEAGEICIKGGNVFRGYYGDREATEAVFDDEGWFMTGDLGRMDDKNRLWITGRKKDILITSGGKNVAPQPIEELFRGDDYIGQLVLFGDRRKYLVALVSPRMEAIRQYAAEQEIAFSDVEALVRHPAIHALIWRRVDEVNRELPSYKTIKKIAIVPDEFSPEGGELTPTARVRRTLIRNRYEERIESLYRV
jgi:long-chain acyl-CoA synthetase